MDRKVEDLTRDPATSPVSVSDWPRIQTAIWRRGEFVIETETQLFTAKLRFSTQQPDSGDYEIHHRPRGGIEKGRTTKVESVAEDVEDPRLSMLTQFATRYAVVTIGEARPYTRMVWLVGLRHFRSVDETGEKDGPVV